MKEKRKNDIFFTKLQLFFLIGIYYLIERCWCYLVPFQFDYEYLKITRIGAVSLITWGLPLLLCLFILWGRLPQLLLSVLLIFTMALGCILPIFYVLYPPTISRTSNPQNYLKLDVAVQSEMEYIVEIFPEKIPLNAKEVQYMYQFSEEGMDGGFTLFLAVEWEKEEDYLKQKKELPESLTAMLGEGLHYQIKYDDVTYRIEYQMRNWG